MKDLIIISVVYLEPEWLETKKCIDAQVAPNGGKYDVYYVERNPKGCGSLAEAINRGFKESGAINYKYAWFVTNVIFDKGTAISLHNSISQRPNIAILHPAFESDHYFCRPDGSSKVKIVPFVEFTSPIVRTDIFKDNPLDESMPFWGHDPDFGLKMWQKGYAVAVDHENTINHTYIRNNTHGHPITKRRFAMRRATDESTKAALTRKYGKDWRWMFPRDERAVNEYWKRLNIRYGHHLPSWDGINLGK